MSAIPLNEAIQQFTSAIASAGLTPPNHIEADGQIHRFSGNGKPKDKASWYKLHPDSVPAGAFGDWRQGLSESWSANLGRELTTKEKADYRAKMDAARKFAAAEQAKRADKGATTAAARWERARPAPSDHAYLLARKIGAHGARIDDGELLIPVSDGKKLCSLQGIRWSPETGKFRKKNHFGGRMGGGYYLIGEPTDVLCISEGFATAASVHEATGYAACAAFSAGNLIKVAKTMAEKYPGAQIIICGDNDLDTKGNPGVAAATEAARTVGGVLAIPTSGDHRPAGVKDFNDMTNCLGPQAVAKVIAAAKKPDEPKFTRFPRIDFDDIQLPMTSDYLLKGILHRGMNAEIYGPSGDGKTFFAIDMLLHVSCGMPWRDKRVKPALVVYVAAEAGASIARRFVAWRNEKLGQAREGRTPFAILTRGPNLMDDSAVAELLTDLRTISEDFAMPIGLVAFDTLSRSAPGADENSPADMTRIIGAADGIRAQLGAAVLFVHHSGKDVSKGARGHTALLGACDTIICVVDKVATLEKSRDGASGETFPFDLTIVDIGLDDDNEAITTCLVNPVIAPPSKKHKEPAGRNQQVVWQTLKDVISQTGEIMPETSAIPKGTKAVKFDDLCARAVPKFPGMTAWRAKDRISQALVGLQATRLVGCQGEYVWAW